MPRKLTGSCILTINAGSSSIKFGVYQPVDPLKRWLYGKINRIGVSHTELSFQDQSRDIQRSQELDLSDHKSAAVYLIEWLEKQIGFDSVLGVGHRVVHGLNFTEPQRVTDSVIDALQGISSYDPDHLPREIELIKIFAQRHPHLPQVACFDTAFHGSMPSVARLLALPRAYYNKGIRRYGFHGLSYTYLMEELSRRTGKKGAAERVILAHLGNGASLAAVKNGRSIDTSMGFTPASGLVMGTRCGDLDPGIAWYLMQTEQLTPQEYNNLINHKSGLLGVSETSSDMHDLLDRRTDDNRAAEAIELFCYQVRKWIGAFAAALEGLDILVFTGGIGENSAEIRHRICAGLEFLGIEIDRSRNKGNAEIISSENRPVKIHVIHTDEELIIARAVCQVLDIAPGKDSHHENVKR